MLDDHRHQVYYALSNVWDPELGIDIVSLGLIYDVRLDPDEGLEIDMTLTTPGCPVSDSLPAEARNAVARELPQFPIRVNIVWEPAWTPERLSPEASEMLGFTRARR